MGQGDPLCGGSTALAWLRRDVELLLAIELIQPDIENVDRLPALGEAAPAQSNGRALYAYTVKLLE